LYYVPVPVDPGTLALMAAIDREYMAHPFFGIRKMTVAMNELDFLVNHKRIARLMHLMGIQAVYPGPKTSKPAQNHKINPYLLRGLRINEPDHVWSTDLTYIPIASGFMYLVAVIDWFSRYVLAWGISNTQDAEFCVRVLKQALSQGTPKIFNINQGAQFTSETFLDPLLDAKVAISMDGRGRALDNVFVERLSRSVKYEDVYLHNYETAMALLAGLGTYFEFYNNRRFHIVSFGHRILSPIIHYPLSVDNR
jgi:putative transposase